MKAISSKQEGKVTNRLELAPRTPRYLIPISSDTNLEHAKNLEHNKRGLKNEKGSENNSK